MRIKIQELRKIIRSIIKEQGWMPGKWNPETGEPVEDKEIERMKIGGLGKEEDDENENL